MFTGLLIYRGDWGGGLEYVPMELHFVGLSIYHGEEYIPLGYLGHRDGGMGRCLKNRVLLGPINTIVHAIKNAQAYVVNYIARLKRGHSSGATNNF